MVLAVLFASFAGTGNEPGGIGIAVKTPDAEPLVSGSSPKNVAFEMFTGTWCGPCAYADPPSSRIMDEYAPEDIVVLMYHLGSDPYANAASSARDAFYDIQFVPTLIVDGGGPYSDGTLWAIGASSSRATNYDNYRSMIDGQSAAGTFLTIGLRADLNSSSAWVEATITATDPVTVGNLVARFVLYEDALYYMGSNGEPFHRSVVRDMRGQPLSIAQGETVVLTQAFTLSPSFNRNKIGAAVLVQTNTRTPITIMVSGSPYTFYKGEIVQAARVDFVTPGIVVYRDEPLTDYTNPYERLLSQGLRHFRTWNVLTIADRGSMDERGPPGGAALAEHPMVVWFTGWQSSGTLTAAEQTLLEGHLAGGNGHLLLTGENLGVDIGGSAFYSAVLQTAYVGDSSGKFAIEGVAGDPVSGSWATASLGIAGSSPDVVDPVGTGVATFVYSGGTPNAAIRSDYDADSRVVYMAYRYFEGNDPERMYVLGSVIRWFDTTSGPEVQAVFPNGGETLMPGTTYTLRWSARDVEIPADAVDLYFTDDAANPTWTRIASGEPNDGTFLWDPPTGVDSDRCRLRVVVRDGAGNVAEDLSDADFTIGNPVYDIFSIGLQPGLNLVSFPVRPQDRSVPGVLASVDPDYAWVRVYDPTSPADPWRAWHRSAPMAEVPQLHHSQAFWVEVTSPVPVTWTLNGLVPSSTTIRLTTGWNLVGFPSSRTDITVGFVMSSIGATAVTTFDPAALPHCMRTLAAGDVFVAGYGYWIYVPTPVDWVVPYA